MPAAVSMLTSSRQKKAHNGRGVLFITTEIVTAKADSLLTVDDAAARLGKAPETVRRWIAAGTLKQSDRHAVPGRLRAALDLARQKPTA